MDAAAQGQRGAGPRDRTALIHPSQGGPRRSLADRLVLPSGRDVDSAPMPDAPQAPADVAAPPSTATVTASGLAYRVLSPGAGGVHPRATDTVRVHYSGWTTDGKLFDSSVARGAPARFPLDAVIAGWTEGLQCMTAGEKAIFWIPEALAYQGKPGRPAGMLVFEVELLAIE